MQPLAVVTWGCVFRMGWVRHAEVKAWLLQRDIQFGMDEQRSNVSYQRGKPQNTLNGVDIMDSVATVSCQA